MCAKSMTRSGGGTILGAAWVAILLSASTAMASPLDLFGFGGRSPGMAGTGVALSTGYDSVYLNPAGLADVCCKRLTLGGVYGDFALTLGDQDTGTEAATGVVFGGALPVPLGGSMRDRVGFALGLYIPTAAINRARAAMPGDPTFALLESRSQVVGLQTAIGVKINQRWRAGIGMLALAALRGGIDVTTDAAGRFTSKSEEELISYFTPILGGRYLMPERNLQLGLTFRGVSRSDYDLEVTNTLGESLPLTIPTIKIAGASQYDPLTLAFEGAWQARPDLVLVGQLAYQRWSAFPLPTQNPVAATAAQESPGFHDIVVPRIAAEWIAFGGADMSLSLRGGYWFAMSPAPEMDGQQSLLDNHRHVLAAGVGFDWPAGALPLHIDLWFQGHLLAPRRHTKELGQYQPGDVVPFYIVDTSGHVLVGGLTVGLDL
jgi:long-chain fatty acid transport protein